MAKKIINYIATDSTNAYRDIESGDYLDNVSKNRLTSSFITFENQPQNCPRYAYYYSKPRNEYLGDKDDSFFAVLAPVKTSSDGRRNEQPHMLAFTFDSEEQPIHPGKLIDNYHLKEAFDIMVSNESKKEDRLSNINYLDDTQKSVAFGDVVIGDSNYEEYAASAASNRRQRMALEILDRLINNNFKKHIAVVAENNEMLASLPAMFKAILLEMPYEIAKSITFITYTNRPEDVDKYLLSGIDKSLVEYLSKDVLIVDVSKLDGKYDTPYCRYANELLDKEANDTLGKLLFAKGNYKDYLNYIACLNTSDMDFVIPNFLNNFDAEDIVKSDLFARIIDELSFNVARINTYNIEKEKLIELLVNDYKALNENAISFISSITLDVLLDSSVDRRAKEDLVDIFLGFVDKLDISVISYLSDSFLEAFYDRAEDAIMDNKISEKVASYFVTVINYLLFSKENTQKDVDLIEMLMRNSGNNIPNAFLRQSLLSNDTSLEWKYRLLQYFIRYFDVAIPDIDRKNDGENLEVIAKAFLSLVQDGNNINYNLDLYNTLEKLGDELSIDKYSWLDDYLIPPFKTIEEVKAANKDIMTVDAALVRRIHYQTSVFFANHLSLINLDSAPEIDKIYEAYRTRQNEVGTALSVTQVEASKDALITDKIASLLRDRSSKENANQVFSYKVQAEGEFYLRRKKFVALTKGMTDADIQSRRIFRMHTSSFIFLIALAILAAGLLIPIYILNRYVFLVAMFAFGLSILYSVMIQFFFSRAGVRVLNKQMFLANLYGVYIPEIITIIILVIMLFV